ncbi:MULTISPECIES: riboflavin synthase [unclassified Spirosoma]|uniref:riboflavin synthase n=1 Tax=unclassified Spirosoma TaxID=2621999 RepID=UPI000960FDE2|nr:MULTISPECIES: riboflavin synthase [unclassified Spirosoma]MBN8821740.1 riboflavin synthase [Spirosoma sp.]OJW80766.1 MAG: riboflavin synthase subunit alpha [Spirosoma sp. 48-14]
MFTGIVETAGTVSAIESEGTNLTFRIESNMASELKIDQSVSHNGVCLTVTSVSDGSYTVTAVDETLRKTNLGQLKVGDRVNLERCMPANGRFDGHIVQGHVDQTGVCTNIQDMNGSWLFDFQYEPDESGNITVEKGSICINGVSLTVFNSQPDQFRVTIIPYTYEHTTFRDLTVGDRVNLEFDIVGKYIKKMLGNAYFVAGEVVK